MTSEEVLYKGSSIVIYMHNQPKNYWLAEISIDGEPRPITRFSAASRDFVRNEALRLAKAMIDSES